MPTRARVLALVVDDPEATTGTFTHWVVVDIPVATTGSTPGRPPAGGREVANDTGRPAYFGPCPPSGTHHYRFTLYALRGPVTGTTLPTVLSEVRGSAIATTRLVGTYGH